MNARRVQIMVPYSHWHQRRATSDPSVFPYTHDAEAQADASEGLFVTNILRMAIPSAPLRVNRIIEDTPAADIATLIITVESTNPVFLARFLKSV